VHVSELSAGRVGQLALKLRRVEVAEQVADGLASLRCERPRRLLGAPVDEVVLREPRDRGGQVLRRRDTERFEQRRDVARRVPALRVAQGREVPYDKRPFTCVVEFLKLEREPEVYEPPPVSRVISFPASSNPGAVTLYSRALSLPLTVTPVIDFRWVEKFFPS